MRSRTNVDLSWPCEREPLIARLITSSPREPTRQLEDHNSTLHSGKRGAPREGDISLSENELGRAPPTRRPPFHLPSTPNTRPPVQPKQLTATTSGLTMISCVSFESATLHALKAELADAASFVHALNLSPHQHV